MCNECKILTEQHELLQALYDDAIDVINAHREQIKTRDKAIAHLLRVIETGEYISAKKLVDYSEIGRLA